MMETDFNQIKHLDLKKISNAKFNKKYDKNIYLDYQNAFDKFLETKNEKDREKAFDLQAEFIERKLGLEKGTVKKNHEEYKENREQHKKTGDYKLKTKWDLRKEKIELEKKFGNYKKQVKKLLRAGKISEFTEFTKNYFKAFSKFNSDWLKTEKNRKIVNCYFDMETRCLYKDCWERGIRGKTVCWIVITDSEELRWGKTEYQFRKLVESIAEKQRREVKFWAHNLLNFDSRFFADKLFHKGAERIKDYGIYYKNVVFFDTWKCYQGKLEDFISQKEQKEIKSKGKELFESPEYHKAKPSKVWLGEMLKYCKNDVNIVKLMVDSLWTSKKGTRSSQAMYFFRKQCIDFWDFKKYFPNFNSEEFDEKREFVQQGFKGGLCDIVNEQEMKIIDGKAITTWKADMKSAYSWIMVNKPMPIGKGMWINNSYNTFKIEKQIDEKSKIYDGVIEEGKKEGLLALYEIEIKKFQMKEEFIKNNFPAFIYTKNEKGMNIASYGLNENQIFYVWGNELKFLLKYCEAEYKIKDGLIFRTIPGKNIFGKFVEELFPLKQKLEKEKKEAKLIENQDLVAEKKIKLQFIKGQLNGLFGKFGQKVEREKEKWISFGRPKKFSNGYLYIKNPLIKEKFNRWKLYEPLNYSLHPKRKDYWGFVNVGKQKVEGFNYNPISATITSYMRVELLKAVILNKDIVLAYDTDGMICKEKPKGLDFGLELGQWELDSYTAKFPYRATNSKYLLGPGLKKMAGIPENARFRKDVISGEEVVIYEFWKIYLRGVRIKESEKIFKVNEWSKKKLLENKKKIKMWIPQSFYSGGKTKDPQWYTEYLTNK